MEDRRLQRLVRKARRGQSEAFSQLVDYKIRDIIFVATKLMGNKGDGEDAAQEAVIAIAQNIGSLKNPEYFETWVYRIVFNVCMTAKLRRTRKEQRSADMEEVMNTAAETDTEVLPESRLVRNAENDLLMKAIDELPENYRMCLLLFYYEGMSYAEIAQTLGVGESAVASLLVRAKRKMREALEGTEEALPVGTQGQYQSALTAQSLSQAFEENAEVSVDEDSVTMVKNSITGIIPAGVSAKIAFGGFAVRAGAVASLAAVLFLGGFAVYNAYAAWSGAYEGTELLQEAMPGSEDADVASEPLAARVVQQPDGATMVPVLKNDETSWQEFQAKQADMRYVGTTTASGYSCEIYQDEANGTTTYYVVIDGGAEALSEPIMLDVNIQ